MPWGFPGGASGKESACQCRKHSWPKFHPWVKKTSWNRKWLLVLLVSHFSHDYHSSILAWKMSWAEEPGRLHSMGSQRVRHDCARAQYECIDKNSENYILKMCAFHCRSVIPQKNSRANEKQQKQKPQWSFSLVCSNYMWCPVFILIFLSPMSYVVKSYFYAFL